MQSRLGTAGHLSGRDRAARCPTRKISPTRVMQLGRRVPPLSTQRTSDGEDLRKEPIEVRKATLASILRKSRPGVRMNEHMEHPEGAVVFQHACKIVGGHRLEAAGIALPVGPVARLAEVQEPGGACGEAGG